MITKILNELVGNRSPKAGRLKPISHLLRNTVEYWLDRSAQRCAESLKGFLGASVTCKLIHFKLSTARDVVESKAMKNKTYELYRMSYCSDSPVLICYCAKGGKTLSNLTTTLDRNFKPSTFQRFLLEDLVKVLSDLSNKSIAMAPPQVLKLNDPDFRRYLVAQLGDQDQVITATFEIIWNERRFHFTISCGIPSSFGGSQLAGIF